MTTSSPIHKCHYARKPATRAGFLRQRNDLERDDRKTGTPNATGLPRDTEPRHGIAVDHISAGVAK